MSEQVMVVNMEDELLYLGKLNSLKQLKCVVSIVLVVSLHIGDL